MPTNYASYYLYLPFPFPPLLLTDNFPCDLYFCDSVPVLVVCLVFVFVSVVDSCEFVVILLFIVCLLYTSDAADDIGQV